MSVKLWYRTLVRLQGTPDTALDIPRSALLLPLPSSSVL